MKKYYFIGISGTAMGSVAGAMSELGFTVTGSDENVYPPMSTYLQESGIRYYEKFSENNIAAEKPDVVVVGNSVSRGNPELEYALDERLQLVSMPEVVRDHLIARHTSVVIAGTHGKTTTTSLAAWLLQQGEKAPGFLVGGIERNFGRGCRPVPEIRRGRSDAWFVTEGDEYDTAFFDKRSKFLLYRPDIAVINNLEFDHADIFASLDDIRRSFRLFARLVPRTGRIFVGFDEPDARAVAEQGLAPVETFGLHPEASWYAADVRTANGQTSFVLWHGAERIGDFSMQLVGDHNVKNAVAALCVGLSAGIAPEQLQQGLASFAPPKRRMEELYDDGSVTLIDDFAHHPTAIAATLDAVAKKYPRRRIVACFEPRSNSTTRNIFQRELAESFDAADVVVIGAVNRPDRYAPDELLDVQRLADDLVARGKQIMTVPVQPQPLWAHSVVEYVQAHRAPGDVIVLMSNGSFGNLRELLSNVLKQR